MKTFYNIKTYGKMKKKINKRKKKEFSHIPRIHEALLFYY